jgi:multisubunit Na+/H+ antiporter MnhB subunit
MTETNWLIARITGALLAAILFIAILVTVVAPLASGPFQLDVFRDSEYLRATLIPVNDFTTAGKKVIDMLWGYRGIDSILQGLIFVVAAVGAATLFRLERGKAEESKEE